MKYCSLFLLLALMGCQPKGPDLKCVPQAFTSVVPSRPRPVPPEYVVLRGQRWAIFFADDTEEGAELGSILKRDKAIAETFCESRIIAVTPNLPIAGERQTIFHELLHASVCGYSDDSDEQARYYNSASMEHHDGIDRIASFFSDLIHENPELVAYFE